MIICCDLDGVVANTSMEMLRRYDEVGIEASMDGLISFKWEDCFGSPYEGWIGEQLADPTFWLNIKPYEDAWYMLNKWFNDLHDIYYLTARWEEGVTLRWLDEWDLPYNDVITGIKTGEKYKHVKKLGGEIMIEDRPEEILALSNKEVVTFVPDRPWNKEILMI